MDVINTKYEKDYFDPLEFQKAWISQQPPHPQLRFTFRCFHQFWQGIQESDLTLLEFGGGPSIYPLVSAAPHLKHVVFSDYNQDCRKAVEDWRRRKEGAIDWGPIVEYIVEELEEKGEDEVRKREDEIREKIRAVVHCDVMTQDLSQELQPPYDVVSLSFCLVVCIYTDDEFKEAIRKLTNLLKPGGYLVMADVIGGSFYRIGEKKYRSFGMTKELVIEAMASAGLQDIDFTSVIATPDLEISDEKEHFVMTGRLRNE